SRKLLLRMPLPLRPLTPLLRLLRRLLMPRRMLVLRLLLRPLTLLLRPLMPPLRLPHRRKPRSSNRLAITLRAIRLNDGPGRTYQRLPGLCLSGGCVTVSVRDARGTARDREWIESVYRDYLDDLSPLNTGVFSATSLGEIGYSESDQLNRWFGDSSVNPLVILRGSALPGRPAVDYRMAEFFVGRTWRRRGVGRLAVELILNRFAGRWEITEYLRNPVAVAFWRRVVANYTQGRYQERVTNGEVRQVFESGLSRAQKPA